MAPKAGKAKPKGKGDKKKKDEKGAANYTCPIYYWLFSSCRVKNGIRNFEMVSRTQRERERQIVSFNFVYNCDKFADGEKSSAS